ncbi:MAG TPA: crossover junction endodeoxyribonuclease RuvC [Candidatus Babeliales bacterium]|nr:crossover junction endodeoxyribonuclease RuvC [Candidatus Babeliales bacterium]
MVILGVDPGFKYAGFGIIKKEQQKVYLLDSGCLAMSPTKSLAERIAIFHDFFATKIGHYNVTDLSLETPFLGKNAQNFLKLGYLRGTLYLLAHKHNLQLHEFSPTEVKQAVTGFGGASKDQVSRIVLKLFPRLETPKKQDVTDALAVTLCGLWRKKNSYLL